MMSSIAHSSAGMRARARPDAHSAIALPRTLRLQLLAALQPVAARRRCFSVALLPARQAAAGCSSSRQHARPCRPAAALPPLAMINVDFASPSLVLGITLIGCGIALLQVRNMQREVSRDADIVVAAMISIVGSTLIFQGWRLDPLLLLCQALTTSVAFWYGVEAFKLRAQVTEEEQQNADVSAAGQTPPPGAFGIQQQQQQQGSEYDSAADGYTAAPRPGYLPPLTQPLPPWATQQQQQQAPLSGRWGLPPADSSVRYDYYTAAADAAAAAAAYEEQQLMAGGIPQQQQQQYGGGNSSSYGGAAGGHDAASWYAQQQQQELYASQQQGAAEGWYGGGAAAWGAPPAAYAQAPGSAGAGAGADSYAGAADGLLLQQDGLAAAAAGGVPLLLPPGEQQQQQQGAVGGGAGGPYERVDDWE